MTEKQNDIEMTAQDIFEVMGRLLANNTELTSEEIHLAIDEAMAEQLAQKIAFREAMLSNRH